MSNPYEGTNIYFNGSDYYCKDCGERAVFDSDVGWFICPVCRNEDEEDAEEAAGGAVEDRP